MKSSLVSRRSSPTRGIDDAGGHCYDALVGLAGCDKSMPGLMMADGAAQCTVGLHVWRLDPARRFKGKERDDRRCVRGGRLAQCRAMSDEDLHELEMRRLPVILSCGGLFRPTTMACVSEAIGLALPGSAGRRRPTIRAIPCRGLGRFMTAPPQSPAARHRDLKALENAATVLPRPAALPMRITPAGDRQRGRHRFRPPRLRPRSARRPRISPIWKPGGRYVMKDLHDVGGVAPC